MSGAGRTTAGEAEGPPPPLDKQALRRHFRSMRAAALAAAEPLILAAARRDLPQMLPAGQHLGLYWPLPGEPDLRPLAAAHPHLALPAVAGEPARLLYRAWRPGAPLAPDRYGIPAPAAPLENAPEQQPEAPPPPPVSGRELSPHALGVLLVPALAFDPQSGIRLGYGGGWYDRLRADPAWAAVPALAVLPSACLTGPLPRDPWDVPFQGWLDEQGVHSWDGRPAGDLVNGQAAPNDL
jgi:5-formyltetrahydrofolate cyclo-ligase